MSAFRRGWGLLQKCIHWVERWPLGVTAALLLIAALGDTFTPADVPFTLLYLLPLGVVTWFRGRRAGGVTVVLLVTFAVVTKVLFAASSSRWIALMNVASEAVLFGIFVETLARLRARILQEIRLQVAASDALHEAQRANEEQHRLAEEAEQMHARMLHMQKLESLGVLAGGIAHDFNNLLTIIIVNAELMRVRVASGTPESSAVQDIAKAAERAAHLTRQMLAYAGRGQQKRESLDLSAQVSDIAALMAASIPKRVSLRIQAAPDLPVIEADVAQLQQVVMNLVLNAAESIDEGMPGAVLVTTGVRQIAIDEERDVTDAIMPSGTYAFVEIHDTGTGIPKEIRHKIFDPFFTSKHAGRGLGLSAVLGVVRSHGGALTLSSEPRRGTRFTAYFPARPRLPPPAPVPEKSTANVTGLALVVDDEPGVRRAARYILEDIGLRVLELENGAKAVDALREHASEVVLVLMDVNMPIMGGYEAFAKMRELTHKPKIVLMSGYDIREGKLEAGLAGFLAKPFTGRELTDLVAALFSEGENYVVPTST